MGKTIAASSDPLGDFFVEFKQKGNDELRAGISALNAELQTAIKSANEAGSEMSGRFSAATAVMKDLGKAVQTELADRGFAELTKQIALASGKTQEQVKDLIALKEAEAAAAEAMKKHNEAMKQAAELSRNLSNIFRQQLVTGINMALGAVQALVNPIRAYAMAGIQASGIGQVLNFQFQQLSLTLGGLFRPELEMLIDGIRRLTAWLRGLGDDQKKMIAFMVEGALAGLAMSRIFPMVAAGIQVVTTAVAALTGGMTALGVMTGGILPAIGLLVTGLTAILVGTDSGREALMEMASAMRPLGAALQEAFVPAFQAFKEVVDATIPLIPTLADSIKTLLIPVVQLLASQLELIAGTLHLIAEGIRFVTGAPLLRSDRERPGQRDQLPPRLGGFESLEGAYQRIASASIASTSGRRSHEQESLDTLHQIERNTDRTQEGVRRQQPAFGR